MKECAFDILGDITEVEVIARGSSIRRLKVLRKRMVVAVGGNSRSLPQFVSSPARFGARNFTGTKPMVSGEKA
jgi:hypothetical protein